jgi:hypothetical protein
MSTSPQVNASARSEHLNCPRCGLSVAVRPYRAAIRHCPRCVARARVVVELFSSTLPVDVPYDEDSLPRADDKLTPASTSSFGKRRQPAPTEEVPKRSDALDGEALDSQSLDSPALDSPALAAAAPS